MNGVALVTGANRGIGLEVCRQLAGRGYVVILTARDEQKARAAAEPLQRAGGDVRVQRLDVADERSVREAAAAVERSVGRLDVLVNNAGILYDTWQHAANADLVVVREAFETNTLGPWRVTQAFLPLPRRSTHARIVNVSSGAGRRRRGKRRLGGDLARRRSHGRFFPRRETDPVVGPRREV